MEQRLVDVGDQREADRHHDSTDGDDADLDVISRESARQQASEGNATCDEEEQA